MGKSSPSKDTLRYALLNGQEAAARVNATAQENIKAKALRESLARTYISSRAPGTATQEDVAAIYA
ncbi:hypothetical protein LMQ04_14860, partial [Staphylococcus aureus]|nr:hypothetical protein [Staphylococcus aureus]